MEYLTSPIGETLCLTKAFVIVGSITLNCLFLPYLFSFIGGWDENYCLFVQLSRTLVFVYLFGLGDTDALLASVSVNIR